jgi:hypothetical protein
VRSEVALLAISAGLSWAQSPPSGAELGTDGQYQPAIEAGYSFECRSHRFGLRYRQERTPFDAIASEDSLRVTLLELTVADTGVSSADMARVRELFRSFAWIYEIRAQCFGREIEIMVRGMPLGPFIASLDDERPDPQPDGRSFRLSPRGIEYLSPSSW